MEEAKKGIWMGISLIMLLLVVSIGFTIYRSGKQTVDNAQQGVDDLNVVLNESKYTDYDGRTITGNQVQSAISRFNGDTIFVRVETKTTTTWYNYSNETLATKIDTSTNTGLVTHCSVKGSDNYINPNGKFKGSIVRDANETIMGIVFTQE